MLAETKGSVQRLGEDEADKEAKFVPPVLVTDVDGSDAVMQQEVSGPVVCPRTATVNRSLQFCDLQVALLKSCTNVPLFLCKSL